MLRRVEKVDSPHLVLGPDGYEQLADPDGSGRAAVTICPKPVVVKYSIKGNARAAMLRLGYGRSMSSRRAPYIRA